MMKWLVKKKSVDPSMDMITEDPLATLELGLEATRSPRSKNNGSSGRRSKNNLSNQIYSVSRTNPLFDGDHLEEYKSSSETSGYSSRDQQHDHGNNPKNQSEVDSNTNHDAKGEFSTISSSPTTPTSSIRGDPDALTKSSYLNPDYVNCIIIDKCELGKSIHGSFASLSPIGEETETDERSIEDSIVTNSLLAMTSGSAEELPEQKDFEDDFPPYIQPIDSRREDEDNKNMDKVIRELSEAVISSRNVLSLTRAMGNKSKNNSLSSNPYSYAEFKSYKNERLSDYFRIKEVNGLQVVNLDEVPSMDPLSICTQKKVQFYLDRTSNNAYEDGGGPLSAFLDAKLLLNQQTLWESYYGLQREIVIDGNARGRRKGVLEAAANGPSRGFFTNNFILESISQPSTSLHSINGGVPSLNRNKMKNHSKDSRCSKNAFFRLIKSLHNSSCFWKSFWIIVGFTVVLIATIATSIYVTKSIIQKNN